MASDTATGPKPGPTPFDTLFGPAPPAVRSVASVVALPLGLCLVETLVLADLLGGPGDLGAHLLRRDQQFEAAVARVRGDW